MGFLIMLLVGDPQRFSIYTTTEKKLHFFEDSFTEFTIRIKTWRIPQEVERGMVCTMYCYLLSAIWQLLFLLTIQSRI